MEMVRGKPPSRSRYKETTVIWLNPKCPAVNNCDVSVTDGIDKALKLIGDRCYMQRLEKIMDGYTKKKKPPMRQHQRAKKKILTHILYHKNKEKSRGK